MQIQWSQKAKNDLASIENYIANDKPSAAKKLGRKIFSYADHLLEQPALGRPGRLPNTRELLIPDTPFIMPYRKVENTIEILGILHSSMRWPAKI